MASSLKSGVVRSWLSAHAWNRRVHSFGLVFCRCAIEAFGVSACCSASCSTHRSTVSPRASAWAFSAAAFRPDGGSWKRGQYGRQKGTSGVVAQWTLTSDARRSGCQLVALRQPQVSCGSGRCFHNPRSTRFSQEKSSFFSLLPSKAVGGLAGGPRDYSLGSQLAPAPCFSMGPLVPSTRGSVAPTGPAILAPSAGATDIVRKFNGQIHALFSG